MNSWFDETLKEQYRLIKVLKSSDKSELQLLRHKKLEKDLVKRSYSGDSSVYNILRGVAHPNIPKVYEVVSDGETVIVLEEYIDGVTVGDVLENGLYKEKGIKTIVSSLCDALFILHGMGIIHRDIKPENVMIDNTGIVKLIDFDSAKIYKPYKSKDTSVIGTMGYAAPEQFGITQSDERTDIFSLGIFMNVCLTGEHPSKKLYQGKLTKVIEKCIQIDPNKRYADVLALKNSFR